MSCISIVADPDQLHPDPQSRLESRKIFDTVLYFCPSFCMYICLSDCFFSFLSIPCTFVVLVIQGPATKKNPFFAASHDSYDFLSSVCFQIKDAFFDIDIKSISCTKILKTKLYMKERFASH